MIVEISPPPVRVVPVDLVDSFEQAALVLVFGAIVLLALAVSFLRFQQLYASGESVDHEQLTNCPSCGARIAARADTCEYCGEPVDR